jgi:hypothetical protein
MLRKATQFPRRRRRKFIDAGAHRGMEYFDNTTCRVYFAPNGSATVFQTIEE